MDKRLVLCHQTGARAGVCEIVGLLADTPDAVYPPTMHYGSVAQPQTARHRRTTPRLVLYQEWAQALTGTFNEFNPAQV